MARATGRDRLFRDLIWSNEMISIKSFVGMVAHVSRRKISLYSDLCVYAAIHITVIRYELRASRCIVSIEPRLIQTLES